MRIIFIIAFVSIHISFFCTLFCTFNLNESECVLAECHIHVVYNRTMINCMNNYQLQLNNSDG